MVTELIFQLELVWRTRSYQEIYVFWTINMELDHLTVSGDVTFGRNVTLKVVCD